MSRTWQHKEIPHITVTVATLLDKKRGNTLNQTQKRTRRRPRTKPRPRPPTWKKWPPISKRPTKQAQPPVPSILKTDAAKRLTTLIILKRKPNLNLLNPGGLAKDAARGRAA